ncbi:hypothetical protein B0H13DRAFT_2237668 [Mycena leptocephala]|nr:hypothetical protein B0H13DRAFT_2237668 [Mycena leptocephala]
MSHGSQWSVSDTPSHHNQGTSYFAPPTRPAPILVRSSSVHSMRKAPRSTSVSSSHVTSRGFRDRDDLLSEADEDEDDEDDDSSVVRRGTHDEDDPITLRDRQSLINVEHPFGLPIWKPALYKKSRSVTRYADQALHSVPSSQAERHLLPGNIFWLSRLAGGFLSSACLSPGGKRYSTLVYGLGWYLAWPFGKYVEGESDEEEFVEEDDDEEAAAGGREPSSDEGTIRGVPPSEASTIQPQHIQSVSWNPSASPRNTPHSSSAFPRLRAPTPHHGPHLLLARIRMHHHALMLLVCVLCWALIITLPMAKLNWALIKYVFRQPDTLRFCAAPPAVVISSPRVESEDSEDAVPPPTFSVKHPRLAEGQAAPGGGAGAATSGTATILLCTYRATGRQYFKYTVGGVNILFVNLVPVVFFVIFDGFVLLRIVDRRLEQGEHVPRFLAMLAGRGLIFVLSLMSVIPLSYFIGMAVASISAQSSIGMGAVINATFGSIIEIILYALMLSQSKGHLVEGSIVGSLLAGVLLMPGMSMCSSALRRKSRKALTHAQFQLICTGCPSGPRTGDMPWICDSCYYKHPDPVDDPFYQSTVKSLMYFCAAILVFSYLIGLWFSLRTHASQIWQNPQQLLRDPSSCPCTRDLAPALALPPHRPAHAWIRHHWHQRHRAAAQGVHSRSERPHSPAPTMGMGTGSHTANAPSISTTPASPLPAMPRRVSYAHAPAGFAPVLESVDAAVKQGMQPGAGAMALPGNMSTDDFTRAVAVATVSALRHQQQHGVPHSPARARTSGGGAPSWSRTTSASVLLICTALYAGIAELLVDVVDVILEGSGIDEKFLGVTLFALVPNTTEFMNAISFALNGNIALSMEIGSAYALQVCLLQIPAMVAFSAWYAPEKMGEVATTFTLIFPRWDVVVIILSMFLMTYTYIEAKSNYHRGSILILSYLVLTAGFYYAPSDEMDIDKGHESHVAPRETREFAALTLFQTARWHLSRLW